MHPFYGPSARALSGRDTSTAGLVSMSAYLAFWGVVVALGWRELEARFPRRRGDIPDPAMAALRERYARGELGEAEFLRMRDVLAGRP
jgi:uncharacterized membrane protein